MKGSKEEGKGTSHKEEQSVGKGKRIGRGKGGGVESRKAKSGMLKNMGT